jgi:hypothetical protein
LGSEAAAPQLLGPGDIIRGRRLGISREFGVEWMCIVVTSTIPCIEAAFVLLNILDGFQSCWIQVDNKKLMSLDELIKKSIL